MICCPLTTQIKNDPFEAFIGGTPPNAILADRVKSIDWRSRDAKPKGLVSTEQLKVSKWAGTMLVQPDARTGPHHHGELETVLYVVKGRIRMRRGDQLEFSEEARPGDFITFHLTSRTRRSMPARTSLAKP
jgi:hypothetical protein